MKNIEQILKESRKRGFHNEVFASLEKVVERLCDTICSLSNQVISSISGRDWIIKEALIKAGKGEVSSQKRRKCQGKERIEGRNPWNSYTSQLKGRKSPMRVGVNRPLWQAYTDLRWRRARVIG